MPVQTMDFEKPLAEIDKQIEKLRARVDRDKAKTTKPAGNGTPGESEEVKPDAEDGSTGESEATGSGAGALLAVEDETADAGESGAIAEESQSTETGSEVDAETAAVATAEAPEPDERQTPADTEAEEAPAADDDDAEEPDEDEETSEDGSAETQSETDARSKSEKRLAALEEQRSQLEQEIYGNLKAWERVQIARHMQRPRSLDYIEGLMTDWTELKGDRYFREDTAVICGLARLDGDPVAVIGQQKGRDTKENVARNFGMMHPEGYRKALRIMRLAERFSLPIIILIDTPGAYPGIGAEERGQSEAIARNIMEMFSLTTPIVGVIVGEGASGGALGVGVVDYMFMLENSWYCVISPEGCASILWRDASKAPEVAEALKLDAANLLRLDVTDETVPEPRGGAHHDPRQTIENLRGPLLQQVKRLKEKDTETLLRERFEKYRKLGVMAE